MIVFVVMIHFEEGSSVWEIYDTLGAANDEMEEIIARTSNRVEVQSFRVKS